MWIIRFLFYLMPILLVALPCGHSAWGKCLQSTTVLANLCTKCSDLPPATDVAIGHNEATPALGSGSIATPEEARAVAENWLRFIVERDGNWGGAESPSIGEFTEFKRGDLLLGYYASVKPQGYMVISSLKDFAPVKAYSTTSNLDPDEEVGMSALLKDVLERRARFLLDNFGGLDEVSLQELDKFTLDTNRLAWSHLVEGGHSLSSNLCSIDAQSNGQKIGPLLDTEWRQSAPYNLRCPQMIGEEVCSNAVVGCVGLAVAQVMKYFCWPPRYYYDWPNMLNRYDYDLVTGWWNDEDGNPCTQAQIDAVSKLCYDAAEAVDSNWGCKTTGSYICHWYYDDARDAFKDIFFYSSPGFDEPVCEDRDDYDYEEWWVMIKWQIDHNCPMVYGIDTVYGDFKHAIVIDGYDDTGEKHMVHANYGWGDNWHNNWYELDKFDCDPAYGWQGGCDWEEEKMIIFIYPRGGLCESYSGTLDPRTGPTDLHHYVFDDVACYGVVIEAGAWVQFLPGTSLTCETDSVDIYGRTPDETRFFSGGLPTRGLKVGASGKIRILPGGGICVY